MLGRQPAKHGINIPGYLAAGLLSTYLSTVDFLGDTIAYGIVPIIVVGIPYAIIVFALSFRLSPKDFKPNSLVPSLALFFFVTGMWLNNDRSLIRGNFRDLYIAYIAAFVFAIVYALATDRLVSKGRRSPPTPRP
jgi:hypothetical protein